MHLEPYDPMMVSSPDTVLLLASEAARLLGVSVDTVRRYARTGRLPVVRTAGGVRLFSREDLDRLLRQRQTARVAS